jgi:hypothetical protein
MTRRLLIAPLLPQRHTTMDRYFLGSGMLHPGDNSAVSPALPARWLGVRIYETTVNARLDDGTGIMKFWCTQPYYTNGERHGRGLIHSPSIVGGRVPSHLPCMVLFLRGHVRHLYRDEQPLHSNYLAEVMEDEDQMCLM